LHTLVLSASLFLLPQTSLLFPLPPLERGLDRPQHPFLGPITSRPLVTLAWIVTGSALLVGWWSGWVREWVREGGMGGAGVEARLVRKGEGKGTDIRNASLFTLYASVAIHLVLVLFSAPITTHLAHTYLLSLLLSILTTFIPAYCLGPPILPFFLPFITGAESQPGSSAAVVQNDTWIRLFAEFAPRTAPERAFVYPAIGTFLGAWAGVIPIGLDWDRPWQAWPLTPAYAAVIGYSFGALGALGMNILLFL
ncbi:hypothetical protein HETIRDRAFT_240833, partial [Heterobasidion irregulare TC 32-1]